MRSLLTLITVIAGLFAFVQPSHADGDNIYHYGFTLSCGEAVYRSFDHKLTDDELLRWTDFFEDTICKGLTPGEGEIQ